MKHLSFVFLILLSGGITFAQQPSHLADASLDAAGEQKAREDIDSLTKLARDAVDKDNFTLAEMFYQRMLNIPSATQDKRDGILQMAEGYESRKAFSKTIAVYETFTQLFPRDPQIPDILLKLGRLYRDAGTYQLALDRFYGVLHSVLSIRQDQIESYKSATLLAQFEIAETYFQMGDYKQAVKFFNLIKLLDLTPENKERVFFKSLHCQFLLDDYPGAITQAKSFIKDFPDSPNVAQARYILATALKACKRPQEALAQVLDLLREGKANAAKDPDNWTYWKKMTGNEIANQFYIEADFLSALTIYQSLAKLNDAPDWQWPVIYQMGICFERLRLPVRAIEAYQFIVDEYNKVKDPTTALPPSLSSLKDMAQWHIDQVKWQQTTDGQLQALLPAPDLTPAPQASSSHAPAILQPFISSPSALPVQPQPSLAAQPSVTPQPVPTAQPSVTPSQPSPTVQPSPIASASPTVQPSPSAKRANAAKSPASQVSRSPSPSPAR